jgi:hypothetical protein
MTENVVLETLRGIQTDISITGGAAWPFGNTSGACRRRS